MGGKYYVCGLMFLVVAITLFKGVAACGPTGEVGERE